MTDSVWWYVLAGFLLGFILSTLWEWLYFRRRRMQIENQRIAELEATVRSLSSVSQSAEANTSSGFAAGYQSPMVFLEGEEDDVDTVEVIVPAPPEPIDYEQPIPGQTLSSEQQRAGTQFVAARAASTGKTPASNGNGVVREAPSEAPKGGPAVVAAGSVETTQSTLSPAALAAGVAAATVWTQDRERAEGAPYQQEQPVTEPQVSPPPAGEAPAAEIAVTQMPAADTIIYGAPADHAALEQVAQEQSPEEHIPGLVGDLSPSRQISAVSTAPDEAEHTSTPEQPAEQLAAQSTPVDQRAGTLVPAAALVSAAILDDRQDVPQQQPEEMVDQAQGPAAPQTAAISTVEVQPTAEGTEGATEGSKAEPAGQPAADTTVRVTTQPTTQTGEAQPLIAGDLPPTAVSRQPDRHEAEEDSGLTPAGVAVLVSALASKLAGDQQRSPETSQQQALQPSASQEEPPVAAPQAAASEPQTISDSAVAAKVVPVVYDTPDTQPSTEPGAPGDTSANISAGTSADKQGEQQTPAGTATGVNPEQDHDPAMRAGSGMVVAEAQGTNPATRASTDSAPSGEEKDGPAAGFATDPGAAPQSLASQEQDPALPLSAILPRAAKPAPLSKSGQARRPDAVPANAVAASGIEPEIEQVSNQLDDLIDSINGLIERTQPLLEQPASQAAPAETPFTSTSPTAVGDYGAGDNSGTEEGVDTGVTGPYSAQNLSRMEYGLVQLMQAVRRLGRDVRSAF